MIMNIRHLLMVILGVLSLERFSTSDWNHSWTIFGQVIYPTGSQISIPPACRLIVELHDISGSNYLFKTIAQTNIDANVFPIIFNITYMRNVVLPNHIYVLNARIVTEYSNILFVNNKRIAVKLLGGGRTTFIDIPVIPIPLNADYLTPTVQLLEWPELVGKDGDQAVEIIKNETGYKEVFTITETSKITKDLRYDRVCIFVDDDNKVLYVPRTG